MSPADFLMYCLGLSMLGLTASLVIAILRA